MSICIGFDGDVIAYIIGYGSERTQHTVRFKNGNVITPSVGTNLSQLKKLYPTEEITTKKIVEPLNFCLYKVKLLVESILNKYDTKDYIMLLGGSNQKEQMFRYKLDPNYKSNRKPDKKPIYLKQIKDYIIKNYNAKLCDDMEVDDYLGILATANGDKVVTASIDKDLLQFEGRHYNIKTKEEITITKQQGAFNLMKQCLIGDRIDAIYVNLKYKGKKIGKMTAEKLLLRAFETDNYFKSLQEIVESIYKENGDIDLEKYKLIRELVFIRRNMNQDFTQWSATQ